MNKLLAALVTASLVASLATGFPAGGNREASEVWTLFLTLSASAYLAVVNDGFSADRVSNDRA